MMEWGPDLGLRYVNPSQDSLADDTDQDGWDRERDGRMAQQATSDDAVTTAPWPGPEAGGGRVDGRTIGAVLLMAAVLVTLVLVAVL